MIAPRLAARFVRRFGARFVPRLAALVLLSIPTLASCQVAALPTIDDFREGEQWTWRRIDASTNRETVTWRRCVLEEDDQVFMNSSKRYFTIEQVYQGLGWREWPLEVGKRWKYTTSWNSAVGDDPGTTVQDVEVAAYEKVTVPAGTFMAFRIEYKGSWGMTDVAGHHWTGDVSDTYWYAPAVKADVKHRFASHGSRGSEEWQSELTSYVPAR